MPKISYKDKQNGNGGLPALLKELWNAAVELRGNIEPSDYKRYVLPLIFLRFLSLRYEKRRSEIDTLIADPQSDFFTNDSKLADSLREDPDLYTASNVFLVPEEALCHLSSDELIAYTEANYREGYGDKWAVPAPVSSFPRIGDLWGSLEDFMAFCRITQTLFIERDLFV